MYSHETAIKQLIEHDAIEKVLVQNGFTKYRHTSDFIAWSIEDLCALENKEWYLA